MASTTSLHQPAPEWRPLLSGDSAARARQTIDAIAARLRHARPAAVNLADGSAGVALLFAYLHEHTGRPEDLDAAGRHLERTVAEIGTVDSVRLLDGVTGVAWAIEHVAGEPDGDDQVAPVDAVLLAELGEWEGRFDVSMGLAGFGLYALERWPRPSARQIGEAVARRLLERFDGSAWPTPAEHVTAAYRELAPAGYINLGVAHGAFGPIGVLAGLAARTGEPALLEAADRAVAWIADHRLGAGGSRLPYWVPFDDGEVIEARLGWCYGDAGAAAALLAAAEVAGRDDWVELALDLADAGAARSLADSGVKGPGLCHGSAGIGHIYNRLGQRTGDARYLETARRWLEHALDTPAEADDLLNGSPGVGLALLAAVSEIEPEWDRVLLMSMEDPAG